MTLYTKCTDISDEAMVCSFLFRCARWKVLDQYRKQQGARPVEAGLEIPEAVIDENALELLENPVLEGEVLDIVYSVFSKYTDRDVNIFLQYKVDEISVNQIAADSGVTPYKVRKITRNISYTLKENLARYAMSD